MQDSRGALYKIISTHLNLSSTARKTRIYYYYFLFLSSIKPLKELGKILLITPKKMQDDHTATYKVHLGSQIEKVNPALHCH